MKNKKGLAVVSFMFSYDPPPLKCLCSKRYRYPSNPGFLDCWGGRCSKKTKIKKNKPEKEKKGKKVGKTVVPSIASLNHLHTTVLKKKRGGKEDCGIVR